MEFKGIPITGALDNMISKLKAQGYELAYEEENTAVLEGKFANENCEVIVYGTPKTKIVYQIIVIFGAKDSWWTLKSDYKKLKEQIRAKYNVRPGPDAKERFVDPYYEGDGYELQALRKGKCLYLSTFDVDNGTINILLSEKQSVYLYYIDAIGDDLNEQEENQSSYDDL